VWFSVLNDARAASLTFVSDTISTSRPGINANHTIKFTVTNTVPPSGKIIITPQAGALTIPTGLDHSDIDLLLNGTNQPLASSPGVGAGSAIGASVASGTSGNIVFTLNDANAIFAGSTIIIKVGTNAIFADVGDQQIANPATVGSYKIYIQTQSATGPPIDDAFAMIAIISPVSVDSDKGVLLATFVEVVTAATSTEKIFINPDGTKLEVDLPQDFVSFSDEIRIKIDSLVQEEFIPAASPPSDKTATSKVYDITIFRVLDGTTITTLDKPLTLDFFYQDSELSSGIDETTLKPYRWDGSQWFLIQGSTVFPEENHVSVPVSNFSAFVLMGDLPSEGGRGGRPAGPQVPTIRIGIPGIAIVNPATGAIIIGTNADGSSLRLHVPAGFWILSTTFTITTILQKTATAVAPAPPWSCCSWRSGVRHTCGRYRRKHADRIFKASCFNS